MPALVFVVSVPEPLFLTDRWPRALGVGLMALTDDPATFDEFHDEPVWADDEPY